MKWSKIQLFSCLLNAMVIEWPQKSTEHDCAQVVTYMDWWHTRAPMWGIQQTLKYPFHWSPHLLTPDLDRYMLTHLERSQAALCLWHILKYFWNHKKNGFQCLLRVICTWNRINDISWKAKHAKGLRHTQPITEMMYIHKNTVQCKGVLSAEAVWSSHSALSKHRGGCSIFPHIRGHSYSLSNKTDTGKLMMWDSAN